MADTIDPRFIDKRTAERYIRMGLLDEKVWEKHLKSLADLEDKSATVETAIDGDMNDEAFEDEEETSNDQA